MTYQNSEDRDAGTKYYAYSIEGPPDAALSTQKIILDPYAKEEFFPPAFDRNAVLGSVNNASKAPVGVIGKEEGVLAAASASIQFQRLLSRSTVSTQRAF